MDAERGSPILVTCRAHGSAAVHLVMHGARGHEPGHTLCGLSVRFPKPQKRFHDSGCPECTTRALSWGVTRIRDSDNAWVNLGRVRTDRL